ncbi:MAG: beta-ketoacyl-[acyl-carrier-protein] synthase II [Candidatus Marinimicrobia bacterium]|nr:beta-ketoacyl-[acyl-carrier-protein] synthase II [Candidatus Neomarinimicrobiota bacterium]|tara:strand:- start:40726 stop:41961 length:1236 start_codon:yes stop_codon:yes gene_type:complete
MKVVVTGLGVLAPNGLSVPSYWDALCSGQSGIDTITGFDITDFPVTIAGELKDFNPENYLESREIRKLDRFSILGLAAAKEAIFNSGLNLDSAILDRIGVIIGTGVGGIHTLEEQHTALTSRGPRRVSPYFVPKMIANIAAGQIAIKYGFKGLNQTVISACASANDAIGYSLRLLRAGDADVIITGGTEASVSPLPMAGFANMKALTPMNEIPSKASRPFDLDRKGFVMGEGAGILVLETEEHAKNRNANILAELSGYGSTDDAFHVTQPIEGGLGAVNAMKLAILDGKLNHNDINYINAHGTSTFYNDKNETAAIKLLFGSHAESLKVSSTKSMTGHLLGASGAIEAVACVKAIETNRIPPTINYTTPDPDCDLDYVPNNSESLAITGILSNSFGFGGHNAVLSFRPWKM